jgi:hypothetical protein
MEAVATMPGARSGLLPLPLLLVMTNTPLRRSKAATSTG